MEELPLLSPLRQIQYKPRSFSKKGFLFLTLKFYDFQRAAQEFKGDGRKKNCVILMSDIRLFCNSRVMNCPRDETCCILKKKLFI